MSPYDRTYCPICKERQGLKDMPVTVHVNGKCIHHEEECLSCGKPIFKDQGRYHLSERSYCEECGDKMFAPKEVF